MSKEILVATQSVLVTFDGKQQLIKVGDTAREGHPILAGREGIFVPLRPTFETDGTPARSEAKPKPKPEAEAAKPETPETEPE